MAWIIKSNTEGPVIINDLGIILTKGQMKDLDSLGRETAERSNDVKILMNRKPPLIVEISKDPVASHTAVPPQVMAELASSTAKLTEAVTTVQQQQNVITEQAATINQMKEDMKEQGSKTDQILAALKQFSQDYPVEIRTIKKAMENIQTERIHIAERREELKSSDEISEGEIRTQERILANKDKKLEKNLMDLGKSVTKNSVQDAKDVSDALDELDALDI